MHRLLIATIFLAVGAGACSATPPEDVPPLPDVSLEEVLDSIAGSDQPVVVNVWASWCIPCRSEAPLLRRAADDFGDRVRFMGLNVRDTQNRARSFIGEFFPESPIHHLADRGGSIPVGLGGTRGVPQTFFYAPGGRLVHLQPGVIDERTLALQIDEILRSG